MSEKQSSWDLNYVQNLVYSVCTWSFFASKLIGGMALVIGVVLYCNQDRMLYMPNPPGFPKTPLDNPMHMNNPGQWSTSGRPLRENNKSDDPIPYEESFVVTEDGVRLHVWLLLQSKAQVPTLIYFHGNAGNMGFRLKNAAKMFAHVGINILMMDYRGYGLSEGVPTEDGLNKDADAVLKYALNHPKLQGSPLVAFGRSLGGAVAVSLAQRYPGSVSAVVLENTFLSVPAMVDCLMPLLAPLKDLVLRIQWHSDRKIVELRQPILFISGLQDTLVPPEHMQRLFELSATHCSHRDLYRVAKGGHNDTWEAEGLEYYLRMKRFVDTLVASLGPSEPSSSANSSSLFPGEEVAPAAVVEALRGQEDQEEEEDPEYLLVERPQAIPTMGPGFLVK